MAEENNQENKGSGGGKGLIIVLIALVVILLFAVVGGGFFLYSSGALGGDHGDKKEEKSHEAEKEKVAKEDAGEAPATFKADINDLVLNITDAKGREKLMKLSFSVASSEATIATIIEECKADIADVVINQVSSRSAEELLTIGGKNLFKEELLTEINKIVNETTATNPEVKQNNVKKVLFTSFVIK